MKDLIMPYKDPEKLKEYRKEYYQKNKDKLNEKHKNYRNQNQEKIKEKKKEYYGQNKDKAKEYGKNYRNQNQEKIKEYRKEHYQKNKEHEKERIKEYYEQNKERYCQQNSQRTKIENDVSRLSANNHRQLWDPAQEEILIKLYKRNTPHEEIAAQLSRTIDAIRFRIKRLKKLGKL